MLEILIETSLVCKRMLFELNLRNLHLQKFLGF